MGKSPKIKKEKNKHSLMPIGSHTSNIHHAESRQEYKLRSNDIEIDSDRPNKLDAIDNKKKLQPHRIKA
jgi:hypothetical protein